MIVEGRAIFQQIAEYVEDSIIDGSLVDEGQAPSTNDLAAFYRINPATAAKGITLLVDKKVLYKRRGIPGAVLPHESHPLAREHVEAHVVERDDAREPLGDAAHADQRCALARRCRPGAGAGTHRSAARRTRGSCSIRMDMQLLCVLHHIRHRMFACQ